MFYTSCEAAFFSVFALLAGRGNKYVTAHQHVFVARDSNPPDKTEESNSVAIRPVCTRTSRATPGGEQDSALASAPCAFIFESAFKSSFVFQRVRAHGHRNTNETVHFDKELLCIINIRVCIQLGMNVDCSVILSINNPIYQHQYSYQ
jgi:hypothetical protein